MYGIFYERLSWCKRLDVGIEYDILRFSNCAVYKFPKTIYLFRFAWLWEHDVESEMMKLETVHFNAMLRFATYVIGIGS